jgi:hypothetical protein
MNIDHAAYQAKIRHLSEACLRYTIKDCQAALAACPDSPKAGYYADEICYCSEELGRRERLDSHLSSV